MESRRMASAAALFMLLALAVLVLSFVSCTVPAPFAFGAPVAPVNRAAETTLGPNAPIGFRLFPADNPWNQDISALPVQRDSAAYIAAMGIGTSLHPDFGTVWEGAPIGIPYILVSGSQPKVPIEFYYPDESDEGPYPISAEAPVEGGPDATGDRHIIMLDVDNQKLYEVYDAHYDDAHSRWEAGSGAIWDLTSNALRPDGWTSADAAGLPILPGLVRYDEVAAGEITHALRFTVPRTQRAYVYPATHYASTSKDARLAPMGMRVRLKAGYDISGFPAEDQVILRALKKYGMIVADNGSAFFVSGAPDARWNDEALHAITQVKGGDFEVVETTGTNSLARPIAPAVTLSGKTASVRVRHAMTRSGSFNDPYASTWSATVSYGDGSASKKLSLRAAKTFQLKHVYVRRGTYKVVVRVRNNHEMSGTSTFKVTVRR